MNILNKLCDKYKSYSLETYRDQLIRLKEPNKKDILSNARRIKRILINENCNYVDDLKTWIISFTKQQNKVYGSKLYN